MVIDRSNDRLKEIKIFARKYNISDSFDEIYALLENYTSKNHEVILYRGYLPLSLEFSISFKGERIVGGNIVFQGMFDNKDISSFAMSYSTGKEVSWKLEI